MHWSNWFAVAGGVAMFVALLAVVLDLPATAFYDRSAPGERVLYEGHDPMRMSNAIDANMKYIREATDDEAGHYNALLTSINDSEEPLPLMADGMKGMTASVESIDRGLGKVLSATRRMGVDMSVMAATSASSGRTMVQMEQDLSALSAMIEDLYGESAELDAALRRIERQAHAIGRDGTGAAAQSARDLNAVLPDGIPPARTTLDAPAAGGQPPAGAQR